MQLEIHVFGEDADDDPSHTIKSHQGEPDGCQAHWRPYGAQEDHSQHDQQPKQNTRPIQHSIQWRTYILVVGVIGVHDDGKILAVNGSQVADVVFEHAVVSSPGRLCDGLTDKPLQAENPAESTDQKTTAVAIPSIRVFGLR